ncbi:hypothetical protein SUVZ_02G5510 [Saccharomyces uvarum]|uniref:Uncharacterized protein n=1 Tax=Saccharomyces uvarum TaxID=230603 RepID=A0ABN8WPV5_SACUV|nr:hypothetical protein SUVZ_02G5510 [Saccharomyces uvarum]
MADRIYGRPGGSLFKGVEVWSDFIGYQIDRINGDYMLGVADNSITSNGDYILGVSDNSITSNPTENITSRFKNGTSGKISLTYCVEDF